LAITSIITHLAKIIYNRLNKPKAHTKDPRDRFILLFAAWWILDMAFVWISPRSYEQYYLPLNASAAMLGAYAIALYHQKLAGAVSKAKWIVSGLIGLMLMLAMSWHIFFGISTSPHTGARYGRKIKGYAQKIKEISARRRQNQTMAWEDCAEYIRLNSQPADKIYVWGWYPGIYISARRFSAAPKAVMMPRPAPGALKNAIEQMIAHFKKQTPKFIVDSRKRHIPTNRPPYELWPIVPKGFIGARRPMFLPADENTIARFDAEYTAYLRTQFGEDEALRYEFLKPFRDFVMQNYRRLRMFGPHVLFEVKTQR
jgi:hypothetical protein